MEIASTDAGVAGRQAGLCNRCHGALYPLGQVDTFEITDISEMLQYESFAAEIPGSPTATHQAEFDCPICDTTLGDGDLSTTDELNSNIVYKSFDELIESATTGCGLCRKFVQSIRAYDRKMQGTSHLKSCRSIDETLSSGPIKVSVRFLETTLGFNFQVARGCSLTCIPLSELFLDAIQVPSTPTQDSTESEETFTTIGSWIQECNTHHNCRSTIQGYLPTRVIAVLETHPSLYIPPKALPPDGDYRYTALSHCWGGVEDGKLTEKNMGEYCEGLPLSSLPKTFRDAVEITRRLGIPYLWIDSLCIQQDSKDDWSKESICMRDIYTNAYCTIAVAGSKDSNGGCFKTRAPGDTQPFCLQLLPRLPDDSPMQLCVVDSAVWNEVARSPLSGRAWAKQERLLSRRSIYFGESQVFWECSKLVACEVWSHGIPKPLYKKSHHKPRLPWTDSTYPDLCPVAIKANWWRLVNEYMRCDLTEEKDRLVAISGLAQEFRLALKDDYVAGLWRKTLLSDLMWLSNQLSNPTRPDSDGFYAPSWSWASLKGNVIHYAPLGHYSLAEINNIKVGVKEPGQDNTGKIESARLSITGRMVRARAWIDYSQEPNGSTQFNLVDSKLRKFGELWPDTLDWAKGKVNPEIVIRGFFAQREEFMTPNPALDIYCLALLGEEEKTGLSNEMSGDRDIHKASHTMDLASPSSGTNSHGKDKEHSDNKGVTSVEKENSGSEAHSDNMGVTSVDKGHSSCNEPVSVNDINQEAADGQPPQLVYFQNFIRDISNKLCDDSRPFVWTFKNSGQKVRLPAIIGLVLERKGAVYKRVGAFRADKYLQIFSEDCPVEIE